MPNKHIGRIKKVGIGREAVAAYTKAAAITYFPFDTAECQPVIEPIKDESAWGVRATPVSSAIGGKYAEIKIAGKMYDEMIGFFVLATLGTRNTTGVGPYTHTFTLNNSSGLSFPTFTIAMKDEVQTKMCLGCVLNTLKLKAVKGSYVEYEATFVGRFPEDTTETPALTAESLFVAHAATVKQAANVAGLAGATAFSWDSFELEFSNNVIRSGVDTSGNPERIYPGKFTMKGSVEMVYENDTYYDLFAAHTAKALQLLATSIAGDTLTVDLSQIRLEEFGKGTGLDDEVLQSFAIVPEYKPSEADMVEVKLINGTATY